MLRRPCTLVYHMIRTQKAIRQKLQHLSFSNAMAIRMEAGRVPGAATPRQLQQQRGCQLCPVCAGVIEGTTNGQGQPGPGKE